ncbi:MAG: WbqC family protein [Bacteroidota bacterium]|nr:WbqC family protein [Bacteroidota bacterium]MDX5447646.1 WbqC family protein [Bacteroidota bacterium]
MQHDPLLSTTYAGPIAWYSMALQSGAFVLEDAENFQKQTFRNRCYVVSHQGVQMLNIPLDHKGPLEIKEVRISFVENWNQIHWRALVSGYGSAPFFEILAPELEPLFTSPPERLWDWNLALMELFLKWLNEDIQWRPSREFNLSYPRDLRNSIHPKSMPRIHYPTYDQVFSEKGGFHPGLSIMDAFFHLGPATVEYLYQLDLSSLDSNP